MPTSLTLYDAARKSGIGLHGLMKAIRSGELDASRDAQGGYLITERDLANFQKKQPSLADILGFSQLHTVQSTTEAVSETDTVANTGDGLNHIREAFANILPEPASQPQPAEPNVVPARDLGQWCDRYLDDLQKVDWYLRKLEADADWMCRQLAPKTGTKADAPDRIETPGLKAGKHRGESSKP